MPVYGVWNNKGGTGKTSLAFQLVCAYAHRNPKKQILVIDVCPQANLSELLLGGLTGRGGHHLLELYSEDRRTSVGGYFQDRFGSPFTIPDSIDPAQYLTHPNDYNTNIPKNIDLFAGDPIVEIQTNAIATLSNTQLPTQDTWIAIIDWVKDFINLCPTYSDVFIDLNPSFSIYTQIGISACDYLIVPVMADDSSRRALNNVFSLVYGLEISRNYTMYSFSTKLVERNRALPKIKMILNNRLTQYMGPASAYRTVLNNINRAVMRIVRNHPEHFCNETEFNSFYDIRDFGTTGVVAFAEGMPFYGLNPGVHNVLGNTTQVNQEYITLCRGAIDQLLVDL